MGEGGEFEVWGRVYEIWFYKSGFLVPQEWDFEALEQSTRYDGFTREHPVVKYVFLTIKVHFIKLQPSSCILATSGKS